MANPDHDWNITVNEVRNAAEAAGYSVTKRGPTSEGYMILDITQDPKIFAYEAWFHQTPSSTLRTWHWKYGVVYDFGDGKDDPGADGGSYKIMAKDRFIALLKEVASMTGPKEVPAWMTMTETEGGGG